MTSKYDKISHHVRNEIKTLSLTNAADVNVDTITNRLISKYKEYESYPSDKFRTSVQEAMTSLESHESNTKMQNTPNKVMDLNKTLSVAYAKAAIGVSKRHRPVDESENGDKHATDGDTTEASESATSEAKPSSNQENTSSKKKIRRKVEHPDKLQELNAANEANSSTKKAGFLAPRPTNRLHNLAGIDSILAQIQEMVFYPVQYSHLYQHLGVHPPCGILLHGPSGCGKTSLANAIAGELDLPFFKASGPELIGGTTGESEERVREIFQAALDAAPSVLFIDSLDVIAGKKESSQRGMDRRIIAQLFDSIDNILTLGAASMQPSATATTTETSMDDTSANSTSDANPIPAENKFVILIAATNKPDNIDPGVRGRFSREISLPVPDAASRTKILALATASMRLAGDVDLVALGKLTPGFVGADLHALSREAGMIAVSRLVKSSDHDIPSDVNMNMQDMHIEMNDLIQASKTVQPTAKREGFAVVPNVTWDDVGALEEVREELLHNVLEPISHPEKFKSLGLEIPAGVLFFGPPGCGKTLLAKAMANQSGANFISVKGPELFNMYVGESESKVRQVFSRARSSTPCVIFFDELDALCPKRGSGSDGNNVSERVVNQLLTELDGLEVRKDVYIIAATNRLELIDDAILRPGRLGKLLYVPLPTASERVAILRALVSKNIVLDEDVDLEKVAFDKRADGFSGADLASLVREAGLAVIREWRESHRLSTLASLSIATPPQDTTDSDMIIPVTPSIELKAVINAKHFDSAFSRVQPSVSSNDRQRYDRVHHNIKQGMGAIQSLQEASQYIKSTKHHTYS